MRDGEIDPVYLKLIRGRLVPDIDGQLGDLSSALSRKPGRNESGRLRMKRTPHRWAQGEVHGRALSWTECFVDAYILCVGGWETYLSDPPPLV